MTLSQWISIAAAFLAGSFPTAYVVGRLNGVDIRTVGSGNVGATNVFRTLGRFMGTLTFIVDFLKGFVPVFVMIGLHPETAWVPVLGGLAAVLGHVFTPFLGFRGGKGVATSAGVFLALLPASTLLAAAAFALFFFPTKKVSIGSLAGCIVLPLSACLIQGITAATLLSIAVSLLVVLRHLSNIQRLIKGEEKGFKKP